MSERSGSFLVAFCGSAITLSAIAEKIIGQPILPIIDYVRVIALVMVSILSFIIAWQLSKIFSKKLK